MFAGDDRALDHEHVQPGLERDLVIGEDPLRGERGGDDDLLLLDLADPLCDQLRLDGLAVDLLHLTCGEILGER